ncbi:phosphonoacetaldehyde hydrolase [Vagococcus martis]|uniref:Phosphonoacetaldehyde hydrolase n=1 Tax=Vagococcus martis TaxID=1768210 RepID=A0A1V4DF50_9ENTE|nr:phosphonoacetaldehyde hydrolase [Vagococcus martis]OPF87112.1 phosphonoacetaldehyde hydrolase [Vagococcus martis]
MTTIEGIIFDWAGTTVDYGCFAPVQAFKETFLNFDINVTMDEIREPMGTLKWDHIKTMLYMPKINQQFQDKNGRNFTDKDVDAFHNEFVKKLDVSLVSHTELKPDTLECMKRLRSQGIKIGSTTGFTSEMMAVIPKEANAQGYTPDEVVTPDQVGGYGRPYPYMIFENMKRLELKETHKVIKIGDTISDIQEGVNAGVITIGILEGSSMLGLSIEEYNQLSENDKNEKFAVISQKYREAGAQYIVKNLLDLIELISYL